MHLNVLNQKVCIIRFLTTFELPLISKIRQYRNAKEFSKTFYPKYWDYKYEVVEGMANAHHAPDYTNVSKALLNDRP